MKRENKKLHKEAFFKLLKKKKLYDEFIDGFNNGYSFRSRYKYSGRSLETYLSKNTPENWICNAFAWSWSNQPEKWSRLNDQWETLVWIYKSGPNKDYLNAIPRTTKKLYIECFSVSMNKDTRVI